MLYFIPDHHNQIVPREKLDAFGLGYIASEGAPEARTTSRGPGNLAGTLIGYCGRVNYLPDEQKWVKGPDGTFWVGFYNAAPPGPKELARPRQIAGEAVKLRDGKDWVIPIARSFADRTTLPREMVLGDDLVTWQTKELEEFAALCADADEVIKFIFDTQSDDSNEKKVGIPYQIGMRIVLNALAVNYRIGAIEASMLRLFSETETVAVMRALIDVSGLEEMTTAQKKAESAAA